MHFLYIHCTTDIAVIKASGGWPCLPFAYPIRKHRNRPSVSKAGPIMFQSLQHPAVSPEASVSFMTGKSWIWRGQGLHGLYIKLVLGNFWANTDTIMSLSQSSMAKIHLNLSRFNCRRCLKMICPTYLSCWGFKIKTLLSREDPSFTEPSSRLMTGFHLQSKASNILQKNRLKCHSLGLQHVL